MVTKDQALMKVRYKSITDGVASVLLPNIFALLLVRIAFFYRSLVFLALSIFCSNLAYAEPVVVFGSFTEKENAAQQLNRVQARFNNQAYVAQALVNNRIYYRVVVASNGISVAELKREGVSAGFSGMWTWFSPINTKPLNIELRPVAPLVAESAATVKATVPAQISSAVSQEIFKAVSVESRNSLQTNFSGYLKSYAVAQDSISNVAFATDTIYQSQNSGRLMLEAFTDSMVFQLHYELSPLSVSRSIGGDLQSYSIVGDGYRLADIETSLTNDASNKTQFYQNLDRLNVQWQLGLGDLTVGRQAISFGGGRFINPTDIFLPFDIRTFNTEYRNGVDAVRFQTPWGDLGEVDVGVVLGADGKRDNSAAFLQISNSIGSKDLSFSYIDYAEQSLLSLSLQTEISAMGFWFEAAYVEGDLNHLRASTGLDYAFSQNTLGMIEYHYNGAGAEKPNQYLTLYDTLPYQRGGVFLLGENYLLPSFSWQATPLLSLALLGVINIDDKSAYSSLSAEYNIAENFYMDFALYFFTGDDLILGPQQTIMLGSEYGANSNILYTSLRWYF
jgi:hypothetical protein